MVTGSGVIVEEGCGVGESVGSGDGVCEAVVVEVAVTTVGVSVGFKRLASHAISGDCA